ATLIPCHQRKSHHDRGANHSTCVKRRPQHHEVTWFTNETARRRRERQGRAKINAHALLPRLKFPRNTPARTTSPPSPNLDAARTALGASSPCACKQSPASTAFEASGACHANRRAHLMK